MKNIDEYSSSEISLSVFLSLKKEDKILLFKSSLDGMIKKTDYDDIPINIFITFYCKVDSAFVSLENLKNNNKLLEVISRKKLLEGVLDFHLNGNETFYKSV